MELKKTKVWKSLYISSSIHGVSTEKPQKSEKKNISKKAQKDILKSQKENEMKDSVIREERARLHTEAVRSQNVNWDFFMFTLLKLYLTN